MILLPIPYMFYSVVCRLYSCLRHDNHVTDRRIPSPAELGRRQLLKSSPSTNHDPSPSTQSSRFISGLLVDFPTVPSDIQPRYQRHNGCRQL